MKVLKMLAMVNILYYTVFLSDFYKFIIKIAPAMGGARENWKLHRNYYGVCKTSSAKGGGVQIEMRCGKENSGCRL